METPSKPADHNQPSPQPELLSVRRHFFDRVLHPFLILGPVAALLGAFQSFRQGQRVFALLYAIGFLVFAVAGLVRRLAMQNWSPFPGCSNGV